MMDYLKEAKQLLEEVAISGEKKEVQSAAVGALAFAAVALVERMDDAADMSMDDYESLSLRVETLISLAMRVTDLEHKLGGVGPRLTVAAAAADRVDEIERKCQGYVRRDTRLFESLLERSKDLPGDTPVRVSINVENGYNLNISLAGLREILE